MIIEWLKFVVSLKCIPASAAFGLKRGLTEFSRTQAANKQAVITGHVSLMKHDKGGFHNANLR